MRDQDRRMAPSLRPGYRMTSCLEEREAKTELMCMEELFKDAMSLGLIIITITLLSWFASLFIKHSTMFQKRV